MPPQIHLVNSPEEVEWFRWVLRSSEWLSFDLENTSSRGGLEDWHDDSRIVSAAFTTEAGQAWVMPFAHPEQRHGVEPASIFAELRGHKLVGHNVKYDARWVHSTAGVDLMPFLAWDTMGAAFLVNENRPLSLKKLALRELGVEDWDDHDAKMNPARVPLDRLLRYNGLDAAYTWDLHAKQRDAFRVDHRLARLMWFILMPAIRALGTIEQEGMLLDPQRAREMLERNEVTIIETERAMQAAAPPELLRKYARNYGQQDMFTGADAELALSWAPTSKFFGEWAEAQGWPVLERSEKTSKPSWTTSVLKRLHGQGRPHAEKLIEHRKLVKQRDAFLLPWTSDLARDERVHPTYRPTRFEEGKVEVGAVTGRTSCEKPNMQQVSKPLKVCFIAPPDLRHEWLLFQGDLSQIEVRIVAHVTGDENLTAVYRDERDVYKEMGGRVYNKTPEEVTPQERQYAKPSVLGFLYGMGSFSFVNYARDVYGVTFTKAESADMRKAFFDLFPGLTIWHERVRRTVRSQGYVESILGRRRHLPDAKSTDPGLRGRAERQAINAEIQPVASDIMMMALDRIRREVPTEVFRLCGTVHDSVLGYVRADAVEDVAAQVCRIMVTPDLSPWGVDLRVPLAVDASWGPSWGELAEDTEIKVSSNDFLRRAA